MIWLWVIRKVYPADRHVHAQGHPLPLVVLYEIWDMNGVSKSEQRIKQYKRICLYFFSFVFLISCGSTKVGCQEKSIGLLFYWLTEWADTKWNEVRYCCSPHCGFKPHDTILIPISVSIGKWLASIEVASIDDIYLRIKIILAASVQLVGTPGGLYDASCQKMMEIRCKDEVLTRTSKVVRYIIAQ